MNRNFRWLAASNKRIEAIDGRSWSLSSFSRGFGSGMDASKPRFGRIRSSWTWAPESLGWNTLRPMF